MRLWQSTNRSRTIWFRAESSGSREIPDVIRVERVGDKSEGDMMVRVGVSLVWMSYTQVKSKRDESL